MGQTDKASGNATSRPLGVAMLLPLFVLGGAFAVFKVKQSDEERVRAEGVHFPAVVRDLETVGRGKASATMRIHVDLVTEAGPGRRVSFERSVEMHEIDLFARGRTIEVAIDPRDATRVVFVK